MTARTGRKVIMKNKKGKIAKSPKWRQHHHDYGKRRRKIRSWVLQWKRERILKENENFSKHVSANQCCFKTNNYEEFFLPLDPMHWQPEHVTTWVRTLSKQYDFTVDCTLFAMNGKGLCLMSLDGFRYRSPDGGAVLHADLRRKLFARMLSVIRNKTETYHP